MFENHMQIEALYRYDPKSDKYFYHLKAAWQVAGESIKEDEWVEVTEEFFVKMRSEDRNMYKRQQREGRCPIPGANGKIVRCSEKNKCSECPRFIEGERTGTPLSLDLAVENGVQFPDSQTPDKLLEERELRNALYAAIRELPKDDYHFTLLCLGGIPEREIAKRFEIRQSSVNYRKQKIFHTLMGKLKDFR